jgi:phosphoesterase RecJ-like protein
MWATNTTLDAICQRLRGARRIIVTTHVKPDGDAVGSAAALVRTLNHTAWGGATSPRATAWFFGPPPPWLGSVCGDTPHVFIPKTGPEQNADEEPDAIVVVDTGSWSQLDIIADWLSSRRDRIMVIDHHAQGDADLSDTRFVDVASAAACQPVAELCRLLLGVDSLCKLPPDVATLLYLGMATDTGWFRHSNVGPPVMRAAGDLLAAGAEHMRLLQETDQNSAARLGLIARALDSLEFHHDGRLALMTLRRADFESTGAASGDSGGLTDFTQSIPTVRVSAVLCEALPGDFSASTSRGPLTKISLRSKALAPSADVNAVAKALGGGGHVRAAGAKMELPLDEVRAKVIEQVRLNLDSQI